MLKIEVTNEIQKTATGKLLGAEVTISGNYNTLLGEYQALSIGLIDRILESSHNLDAQLNFASDFTDIVTKVTTHLLEEVERNA